MSLSWILASLILWGADEPSASKPIPLPRPTNDLTGTEGRQLTLREAIRTGLANSEVVHVVAGKPGAGDMVVTPIKADNVGPKLDSALQTLVRSIEQHYWTLSQQYVEIWARETAVKIAEEIVQRERAERSGGRGSSAGLVQAEQYLEKCRHEQLNTCAKTRSTQDQLRILLGIPLTDPRRIIAVTAPVVAKLEPDWETCLKAMTAKQPDLVAQRDVINAAQQKVESLRSLKGGVVSPVPDALNEVLTEAERQAREISAREKALYQQVLHQTTHSLARSFLEVDANYKNHRTALRLREAAQVRLESARAYYEGGKIGFTIDRLLDAVTQYADAIAQEAQFKSSYNVAITALSEAQGMLLSDCQVVVKTQAQAVGDRPAERLSGTSQDEFWSTNPTDLNLKRASLDVPQAPEPVADPAKPSMTSIKYQISIDRGSKTIKLEGKITTSPKP